MATFRVVRIALIDFDCVDADGAAPSVGPSAIIR
jgi:hypothetical protein